MTIYNLLIMHRGNCSIKQACKKLSRKRLMIMKK